MSEITSSEPTMDDDAPTVHSTPCESCGCPVEALDKFCPACGKEQAAAAEIHQAAARQRYFRCKNCGAEVAVDPDQRSYVCPFCDSTYVMEFSPEQTNRQPPEFVIGFAVTPEKAQEKFRRWLAENGWFRPGDLQSAHIEEKLKGVYLPFWSFSMLARSEWSASIGEYWWKTETYTTRQNGKTVTKTRRVRKTEWWDLGGRHHRYYSGYLVSGSRGLPQQHADRIKPFHLPALKRYEPYFLAGWLSEEYSIQRDDALKMCQQEFYTREQQNVAGHLPGDTHSGLRVSTRFEDVNSDLILLPVYLLSYRYQKKLYRFLINGQTGKVAGDKPLSGWRIALAVGAALLGVAAVVGLVMLLGSM
ncbi:MAG: zinc-ribbon domain-containing protein [Pirellulales bacterium]|nr:zinc-ribbon domain-containing protein [Pirellulales bacterium]